MTAAILILAAIGIKAFYLLLIWLASAIAASELSKRKGYGEKWGLGTGLLLSAIGIPIWLLMRPKPHSRWAHRRARRKAGGEKPGDASSQG